MGWDWVSKVSKKYSYRQSTDTKNRPFSESRTCFYYGKLMPKAGIEPSPIFPLGLVWGRHRSSGFIDMRGLP